MKTGQGDIDFGSRPTARREWADAWPIPLIAMAGTSGCAMFAYSSGVFMPAMISAFGWTHSEFALAFVLQMVVGLIVGPLAGRVTDRIGARPVALLGIPLFVTCFALLGIVGNEVWEWWVLCLLVAVAQGCITQIVWVSAVLDRFQASRGLAISITLAGLGLGSLVWPILAAFYLSFLGWRLTFPAMALTWGIIVFPLTALFYFGKERTNPTSSHDVADGSLVRAWQSMTFLALLLAGGLFACAYFGLTVNLVPILRSGGAPLSAAAAIAGSAGLFSIIGRVGAGYLLDKLPTQVIAIPTFLLPSVSAVLLLNSRPSAPVSFTAVALLGLASGAEMDVLTFITAKKFGREVFSSVYGLFVAIISICASLGPLLASALFDRTGSYTTFLATLPVLIALATVFVWWSQRKSAVSVSSAAP